MARCLPVGLFVAVGGGRKATLGDADPEYFPNDQLSDSSAGSHHPAHSRMERKKAKFARTDVGRSCSGKDAPAGCQQDTSATTAVSYSNTEGFSSG